MKKLGLTMNGIQIRRAGLVVRLIVGISSIPLFSIGQITNPGYDQSNLVSDIASNAPVVDPHLVNPWGIVSGRSGVWINDNGTGLTMLYGPHGRPSNQVIHIPGPGGGPGTPTGLVINDTGRFMITDASGTKHGPSSLLMATEDGTIVAWSSSFSGSNAVIVADRSGSGAVYKGLAVAAVTNELPFAQLFAANFHAGVVDMFDSSFNYMSSFTDTGLPPNFAPFNIRRIRGRLFVSFALQRLPDAHDDQAGQGNGYIDIFDLDGTLLRRFAATGPLNSPWGMAIAPKNYGRFSHALLVGNFGDGRINAYDLLTGKQLGHLTGADAITPDVAIEGLWGLAFDHDEAPEHESDFRADRLYFTAGINDEADGLLGYLRARAPNSPAAQ
jgi:uncharacterized protein (TIGR03118 family)